MSQIVELTRFKAGFIVPAAFVHDLELIFADKLVKIVINLPNVKFDFSLQQLQSEERQYLHQIGFTNLIFVALILLGILGAKVVEYTIEAVLLNAGDWLSLEHLPWRLNDFFFV